MHRFVTGFHGISDVQCVEKGQFNNVTGSYRFNTLEEWYNNWNQRFEEIEKLIPKSYTQGARQEALRQRARNLADYIKANYANEDKKNYYLSKAGYAPYSFMMAQEARLYRLGVTYFPMDFETYSCGSGPYTSSYCGRKAEKKNE